MLKTNYPALGETAYRETLPNGLEICVVTRPGFQRKCAYFVTDFGAIHRRFAVNGETVEVPMGIAHFLEHKLFDMPGRDITAEFTAMGVSPNAFTGNDITAYHFSGTDNFDPALALLLEFVTTPYFTPESVEKEQGIIGQEIDMNQDSPDSRVSEALMCAMYAPHRIREPILGTRDSIRQITPELLYQCHSAFYRPDNMFLCVVGDVDPEQVAAIAREKIPAPKGEKATVLPDAPEGMTVVQSAVRDKMDIAMPTFQIGFKCEPVGNGAEGVRMELAGDLAAEALFGDSSALYQRLYEAGMIDDAFGGGFDTAQGMSMFTVYGDSREPEAVRDAILQEAERLCREGIPEADFLRMKRSAIGRHIREMDSFDSLCFRICAYRLSDFDYLELPAVYETVQAEDVLELIRRAVTPERCAICILDPIEEV